MSLNSNNDDEVDNSFEIVNTPIGLHSFNKIEWIRKFDQNGNVIWESNAQDNDNEHKYDEEKNDNSIRLSFDTEINRRISYIREITPNNSLLWNLSEVAINSNEFNSHLNYISTNEIVHISKLSFEEKLNWFKNQLNNMRIEWENGHKRLEIRRNNLLIDSINAFHHMHIKDFHQIWRFNFSGESGIDAGGIAREWFFCVSEALFNPSYALFKYAETDNLTYQINPNGKYIHSHYKICYRFAGQFIAKAIFDLQLIPVHLTRPLIKNILGLPIQFSDLQFVDNSLYESLCWIMKNNDVQTLSLDFSVDEEIFGTIKHINLCANGDNKLLTDENKFEYIDLRFKRVMLETTSDLLIEFLNGFYEIIPLKLLSIFDFQEFELLLNGLTEIDVNDWKSHTEYSGSFNEQHYYIKWFWEIIEEFSQEMRSRLLQFVTGTNRLPIGGFKNLQGSDGELRMFRIQQINGGNDNFIRSHTCFNRLDLPIYSSKQLLKDVLSQTIQLDNRGFTID